MVGASDALRMRALQRALQSVSRSAFFSAIHFAGVDVMGGGLLGCQGAGEGADAWLQQLPDSTDFELREGQQRLQVTQQLRQLSTAALEHAAAGGPTVAQLRLALETKRAALERLTGAERRKLSYVKSVSLALDDFEIGLRRIGCGPLDVQGGAGLDPPPQRKAAQKEKLDKWHKRVSEVWPAAEFVFESARAANLTLQQLADRWMNGARRKGDSVPPDTPEAEWPQYVWHGNLEHAASGEREALSGARPKKRFQKTI